MQYHYGNIIAVVGVAWISPKQSPCPRDGNTAKKKIDQADKQTQDYGHVINTAAAAFPNVLTCQP
jgi:hypothetical protein